MTLNEIRDMLVAVDPDIRHYFTMSDEESYTYWEETRPLPFVAEGGHPAGQSGWRFYVHRFTKIEGDPLAASIYEALDESFRVAVQWTVDREQDTGYIHHIFECEGF